MPSGASALSNEDVAALQATFGASAGARLEMIGSFDQWPMLGQVFGYDARKYPSFKLEAVERDRFVTSMPGFDFPAREWQRLE